LTETILAPSISMNSWLYGNMSQIGKTVSGLMIETTLDPLTEMSLKQLWLDLGIVCQTNSMTFSFASLIDKEEEQWLLMTLCNVQLSFKLWQALFKPLTLTEVAGSTFPMNNFLPLFSVLGVSFFNFFFSIIINIKDVHIMFNDTWTLLKCAFYWNNVALVFFIFLLVICSCFVSEKKYSAMHILLWCLKHGKILKGQHIHTYTTFFFL